MPKEERYRVARWPAVEGGYFSGVEDVARPRAETARRGKKRYTRVVYEGVCFCLNPGVAALVAEALNSVPPDAAAWQTRYLVRDGRREDDHMIEVIDTLHVPMAVCTCFTIEGGHLVARALNAYQPS